MGAVPTWPAKESAAWFLSSNAINLGTKDARVNSDSFSSLPWTLHWNDSAPQQRDSQSESQAAWHTWPWISPRGGFFLIKYSFRTLSLRNPWVQAGGKKCKGTSHCLNIGTSHLCWPSKNSGKTPLERPSNVCRAAAMPVTMDLIEGYSQYVRSLLNDFGTEVRKNWNLGLKMSSWEICAANQQINQETKSFSTSSTMTSSFAPPRFSIVPPVPPLFLHLFKSSPHVLWNLFPVMVFSWFPSSLPWFSPWLPHLFAVANRWLETAALDVFRWTREGPVHKNSKYQSSLTTRN